MKCITKMNITPKEQLNIGNLIQDTFETLESDEYDIGLVVRKTNHYITVFYFSSDKEFDYLFNINYSIKFDLLN